MFGQAYQKLSTAERKYLSLEDRQADLEGGSFVQRYEEFKLSPLMTTGFRGVLTPGWEPGSVPGDLISLWPGVEFP